MVLRYVTTFQDFKAAQRLARHHKPRLMVTYVVFYWLLPIAGLAALAALARDIGTHRFLFKPMHAGLLGGVAFFGLYFLALRPFQLRLLFRRMKQGRAVDTPIELELTEHELISRVPGKSEGRFRPAAIVDFAEDERMALVYVARKMFLMVPKHAATAEQMVELRNWIHLRSEAMPPC